MADPLRLVMMTFPQHWNGKDTLTLNAMLIPSADPLAGPLIGANPATPSFAKGAPAFTVYVNETLASLPNTAPGPQTLTLTPAITSAAADPVATFTMLQSAVTASGKTIGPPATPPPVTPRIRKALPPSYLAAGGAPADGNLTTTDDDFGCAVRAQQPVPLQPPPTTVAWGEVISYAMRQPVLATKLGLRYTLSVTLPAASANAFAQGGYVFVALAASDPWAVAATANPGAVRVHAARIPPLDATPRPVFAAVEFTVDNPGGPPQDTSLIAADVYSDGFAKLVHCAQPQNAEAAVGDGELTPGSDLGIQIGWDDQQVVAWHNDQLALLAARRGGTLQTAPQTPLGVLGYRVDVADVTPATQGGPFETPVWESLVNVTTALPPPLGTFTGELAVEPVPTRPADPAGGDAWLPRYFATWRGGSLCEPDPVPRALAARAAPATPTRTAVGLTTLLSYGHTYDFRVRLADQSSGGPVLADAAIDPDPVAVASQTFQRIVPPKPPQVQVVGASTTTPDSLLVGRPLIAYPEVLYTHLGDDAAARDAIRTELVSLAVGKTQPIAGLPDPDVTAVSLEVAVRHPLHDTGTENGPFLTLYTTTRTLDPTTGPPPLSTDPGTSVPLVYIDAPSIVDWAAAQPNSGPLLIPRGRDIQITVRAVLRTGEPAYFAPQAQQTLGATVAVRMEPTDEAPLLERADADEPVRAFLFRRPPNVAAPPLVAQLADELGVVADGDSLASPPGRRIVFGASRALRTAISADGETLTFGATSDLLRLWVVAIVIDLERDWTWNGITDAGFTVLRGAPAQSESQCPAVGAITVPRVLGSQATTSPSAQERGRTRLIFLDAIDPHEPVPGGFPQSLQHRWFVVPNRTLAGAPLPSPAPLPVFGTPPAPLTGPELANAPLDLRLPIGIPPAQVPAIASVGLALSPYVAGPLYASTEPRRRALWIELTQPIANDVGDALFARVLAHGADPLLYNAQPVDPPDGDPPLALDPELVRVVFPDDTDDRAGITAMTQLERAHDSKVHFLLPLPPGIDPTDPELFGFYTYELRVGHAGPPGDLRWWSTANARFGQPLRVAGVQHPAPPLVCQAGRINVSIPTPALVSALRAPGTPFKLEPAFAPLVTPTNHLVGTESFIVATAPYATPVLNGVALVSPTDYPLTSLWFFVYAQVVQADGASMRNILIATTEGVFINRDMPGIDPLLRPFFLRIAVDEAHRRDRIGVGVFHQAELASIMASVHLPPTAALSVLAVELLQAGTGSDVGQPPGTTALAAEVQAAVANTGFPLGRILRSSPLSPVAAFC
jgi:hypothetical protein